jgi:hypothetical protein
MYTRARIVLTSLLVLMFSGSIAFAQEYGPASGRPAFARQELDQMLAPIALYPDALLSQILMAATYPIEIAEAARWSRRNPGLDGDRAVRAVERMDWDPSVKSLVAFPQILALMDEKLDWTERLGDAFYAQQAEVMDTVQYLRQKAYMAGNLRSTDQFRVDRQGQSFVIELANPELIYVPYYNPTVIYGTWWWPTFQPVYWASWPGYHVRPGLNYNPPHVRAQTEITRVTSNVWQHNPVHRRDVPYRHASLGQPSGHTNAASEVRRDFRGPDPASQPSGNVAARKPSGNAPAPQSAGNPPVAQASPRQVAANHGARPDQERTPGASTVPVANSQPDVHSANVPGTASRPNVEQRPAADGAGHGANARKPSGRGVSGPGLIFP